MRIAYVNAKYQANHTGGGHVHMEQFIANAIALGHEIWMYRSDYPGVKMIPKGKMNHIRSMRGMHALYIRVEGSFTKFCTWSLPPRRLLYGLPVVVWEFNTIPEHGLLRGRSDEEVGIAVTAFRKYARGCDLAVCVTEKLADYAREKLQIRSTIVIPNGSDPEVFHPDAQRVKRMAPFEDKLNVVWIGSGKEPWHDFDMLRQAAEIVFEVKKNDSIAFHILGPDLVGRMADMPANTYYWGSELYSRLPQWLSAMDIGISLYLPGPAQFGSPLKIYDYLSTGLTFLTTPHPSVDPLLEELGQADSIIPFGDAFTLAAKILELSSNPTRVKKLGEAGRQLVIEKYNWRRAVKITLDSINDILKKKKVRP